MSMKMIKGYTLVVFSSILLAAAVVLVALQWGNHAELSVYGKNYSIRILNNRTEGGANTALLMLLSAVGGIVCLYLSRLLIYAIVIVRKAYAGAVASGRP